MDITWAVTGAGTRANIKDVSDIYYFLSVRVSLSPSADYVVGGGGEGGIHVWNVNTGQSETVLRGHTSTVSAVSWHPGGGNVVSVDKAKTCIVWT